MSEYMQTLRQVGAERKARAVEARAMTDAALRAEMERVMEIAHIDALISDIKYFGGPSKPAWIEMRRERLDQLHYRMALADECSRRFAINPLDVSVGGDGTGRTLAAHIRQRLDEKVS